MRTVAGGWFFSFTRVACCSFGQPKNFSHNYLGRVQKEAKGNLLDMANVAFRYSLWTTLHSYINIKTEGSHNGFEGYVPFLL